jgi:hypothetical protein
MKFLNKGKRRTDCVFGLKASNQPIQMSQVPFIVIGIQMIVIAGGSPAFTIRNVGKFWSRLFLLTGLLQFSHLNMKIILHLKIDSPNVNWEGI